MISKLSTHRFARIFGAIVLGMICTSLALPADAQTRRDKKKQAEKQHVIRDKRLGKKFEKIQEHLDGERYAEAKKLLDSINREKVSPFERAMVNQTYAFVYGNDDDFKNAAKYYNLAISEEALPLQRLMSIRFNLGQIYMMQDQWPEAIETLEAWFKDTEKPSSFSYYMLAVAYYQNNQRDKAVVPARQAVEQSKDPKETWIQLLLSLHMEKEDYKKAEPLLVRLITKYSKKIYWIQLAAVLMELEKDKESLAVQQLAYKQGYLSTDRELVRLAQMYLFHDLPFRAAKLLETELETGRVESDYDAWRLYSNALLAAREMQDALGPLETAAKLAKNGEGYLQLSQVHIQNESWDNARQNLDMALQKGDLRSPAHANLLVGIVAYQQKRWEGAKAAFGRATRNEKTREMASKWIEFVDREAAADAAQKAAAQAARNMAEEARAEAAEAEAEADTPAESASS